MRNLKLIQHHCHDSKRAMGADHMSVSENNIYISANDALYIIDVNNDFEVDHVPLTEEGVSGVTGEQVAGLQYLMENDCLCVATVQGNIILYHKEVEVVGCVDTGIRAVSWSPDQELVVIATGSDTLIMMTKDFDPLTEVSMNPEEFGEAKPVTVGWGKKETQFHGSEGKQAAIIKTKTVEPAVAWDDKLPRISWRGDGQGFVVSTVNWTTGARQLRVWSRDCVLQATSEDVNSLEQAVSWSLTVVLLYTMGNYHWYLKQSIDCSATADDQIAVVEWDAEHALTLHIVFSGGKYVRNVYTWETCASSGLKSDDLTSVAVIDGDKLLVTPFRNMVVPPPMCAFHVQLPAFVQQVAFQSAPNTNDMAILLSDGRIAIYEPSGNLIASSQRKPNKHDIVFFESNGLRHGEFTLPFFVDEMKRGADAASHLHRLRVDASGVAIAATLPLEGAAVGVCHDAATGTTVVQQRGGVLTRYAADALTPWRANLPRECARAQLCRFRGDEVVLALTDRWRLYADDAELASNVTSFALHADFLLATTHTHACHCLPLATALGDVPALLAAATTGEESQRRVERGSRVVAVVADSTKVVLQMPRGNLETIHPRALVLATVRRHLDRLEFEPALLLMKKHRINMNLIYDHNPELFLNNVDAFVKQIDNVGNINLFLSELQEEDVTRTMYRTQHAIESRQGPHTVNNGMGKVDRICDAVRQALQNDDIDRFIMCILATHVKKAKPELHQALSMIKYLRDFPESGRVGADEAMKFLLYLVDVNELFDVALGTYDFELVMMVAEKSQKDPKEYLPFLNTLKKMETNYQRFSIDKHLKLYAKALPHLSKCGSSHLGELLDYVKEHKLYAEGLVLYCRGSEEYKVDLRFSIDKHLKLYAKALPHLSKCGSSHLGELLDYVKEHKLYAEGLVLYGRGSEEYKEIARIFAEELESCNKYEESAMMYCRCCEYERALHCFELTSNWQQLFCMAAKLHYDKEKLLDLAGRVSVKLRDERRHAEAAVVLMQYAGNVEEAIVELIDGCLWDEALRLMHLHNHTDIIETDLQPHVLEQHTSQINTVENLRVQFDRHVNRLAVVRAEKQKALFELEEREHANTANADLTIKRDSASGMSGMSGTRSSQYSAANSRISARSSKNRRKAERKKYSLREGSTFEDLALMDALAEITLSLDKMKDDVAPLLRALVQLGHDSEASCLQSSFDSLLKHTEKCQFEIWPLEGCAAAGAGSDQAL
ncbi:PREDICTED: elongator complex protein 1-like, partial [Priapulus caudatus]|uniref:Elongator complex protein 1 n=1 Tax=Priapulus caudatus TaxID=37621 RepID=A0ABM1ET08_PRICU